MIARVLILWGLILSCAWPSFAVVIAGPDGATNTLAPNPDPGFPNVGRIGSLSGVYVRNGWVLTANHVGLGAIVLDGLLFEPVPGSGIRLPNPVPPDPDLFAFKLMERPNLPDLALPSGPRVLGEDVVLIGNGLDRGTSTAWIGSEGTVFEGWNLGPQRTVRWGTNQIGAIDLLISDTQLFATVFDELGGPTANDPEAQAVAGDSGGAAFSGVGANAELVGIMFARSSVTTEQQNQPLNLALYGNVSLMSDLFFYRSEVEAIIDQPDCDDGLDEDGDGQIDFPEDPGCSSALDNSEREASLLCDNGIDDDLDGLIDFPEDPGCTSSLDPDEVPEPGWTLSLLSGALFLRRITKR